ncbi:MULTISPECIES: hypothetical protein [unclassified Streptomyces]|uniref:hypothetical protein n=1 Tax=unclassified Streptomyces TaxID=2593676 RepID=UPI002E2CF647|nr:hypothetical protein [Streptomyces sp. NBC_00223]
MSDEDGLSPEVRRMIEEAQAMMTEEVFEEMLRTKAAVEPDNLATLLDLVAIGITNGTWRNSCIEGWHADGRLSDGDMMRINSHTTDAIRRRLARWTTECGITSANSTSLAKVDVEDVDAFAIRLFRWVTNPKRRLPIGITLGELARTAKDLKEYEDHADRSLGGFAGQMEDKGVRFGLLRTACHGALACSSWWKHPAWPALVERYVSVLDRPTDPHWGPDGEWRTKLGAEPHSVQDRAALRTALLKAPWKLDESAAEWITNSGIRYLSH